MLSKILIGILIAVGGVGYLYYTDTQTRLETLRDNNAKLESANRTNQETITQMQNDAVLMQKLNSELVEKMNAAENKVDELRDKLIDHDLTNLSLKKPGLIEKRINAGTEKAFDYLESVTTNSMQSVPNTGTDSSDGNKDSQAGN